MEVWGQMGLGFGHKGRPAYKGEKGGEQGARRCGVQATLAQPVAGGWAPPPLLPNQEVRRRGEG
jgi:hypothetical protein